MKVANRFTSVVALGLALGLASNAVAPKRAEAVVGLAAGPVGIAVLGGAMMAFGSAWIGGVAIAEHASGGVMPGAVYGFGVLHAAVGLILLDGPTGGRFEAVSKVEAATLGMSVVQMDSYNAHIDEINATAQSVAHELSGEAAPTVELAKDLWTAYGATIELEALEGVAKVIAGARK